jgi:predicted RNase H-like HicB family nuclease
MTVDYTVNIWREKDQFIAHAMPLDIASSGASPEAARAAVNEAVQLFLAAAVEMGTLEEILEESGYERQGGGWVGPAWVATERRSVAVGG